jgi:transposase
MPGSALVSIERPLRPNRIAPAARVTLGSAAGNRWSKRFREERLAGLFSRHAGQEATTLSPALEARILQCMLKRTPPDGTTQWSTRRLGTQLKVSHMMVARVWAKHGLKPQRPDHYMATNDPDFEQKAADIIGLYLNPPAHAAVFCVDEKTAIQALDRKDPVLPLSPGRAERHGFEYFRHGTLSLYAAFDTETGEVLGKTAVRHTPAASRRISKITKHAGQHSLLLATGRPLVRSYFC